MLNVRAYQLLHFIFCRQTNTFTGWERQGERDRMSLCIQIVSNFFFSISSLLPFLLPLNCSTVVGLLFSFVYSACTLCTRFFVLPEFHISFLFFFCIYRVIHCMKTKLGNVLSPHLSVCVFFFQLLKYFLSYIMILSFSFCFLSFFIGCWLWLLGFRCEICFFLKNIAHSVQRQTCVKAKLKWERSKEEKYEKKNKPVRRLWWLVYGSIFEMLILER